MIAPDRISTSPFSNPYPVAGTHVVIHATRSGQSMNPNELEGTLNWFKNPTAEVSAHWLVGRNGQKIRIIPDSRQAWHAGEHNAAMFGIELEQGVSADGFTPPQMAALAAICRGYVSDFGVAPVHTRIVTKGGFIGHEETIQGRRVGKTDPGPNFDWDFFVAMLQPQQPEPNEDDMIRHNATHADNQFSGRLVDGWLHLWDPWSDFNLPRETEWIRLELFLTSGAVRVHDGNQGSYAGQVGWDGARYATIDVRIADGGFSLFGESALFSLLGCIGRR